MMLTFHENTLHGCTTTNRCPHIPRALKLALMVHFVAHVVRTGLGGGDVICNLSIAFRVVVNAEATDVFLMVTYT